MDSPVTDLNGETSEQKSKSKDDIVILNVEGYEGYEDESIIIMRTRNQNHAEALDTVKNAAEYAKQPVKYEEKQSGLEIEKRIHCAKLEGYENIPDGFYILFKMQEKSDENNGADNSPAIPKEEDFNDVEVPSSNSDVVIPTTSTEILSSNASEYDIKITYETFVNMLENLQSPSCFSFDDLKAYLLTNGVVVNSKQLNSYLYRATEKNILEKSAGGDKQYKFKI